MNHQRILIDAPKDVSIVRSKALANKLKDPELIDKMPKYYPEPELPEKYRKKKGRVIITRGNPEDR